jgi:hypothetical protein
MSVRPSAWNSSTPTERIFKRFDIREFFEKLSGKKSRFIKIWQEWHEDQKRFVIVSCAFHIRMRNISDYIYRENQNTHCILMVEPSILLYYL